MQDHSPTSPRKPAQGKGKEIVVFLVTRETKCTDCGDELHKGNLLRLEGEKALCIECADLGHLEFLPRGNAALTRRARKHSRLHAVVVKWSSARRRYERQGILAEPDAIRKAEEKCAADAPERSRHRELEALRRALEDDEYVAAFAQAIQQQFPGCPKGEERQIARHACRKHSGRIGRAAAAKQLDPEAILLAVHAHIRHQHTDYDLVLLKHQDRVLAREKVAPEVDRILERWRRAH